MAPNGIYIHEQLPNKLAKKLTKVSDPVRKMEMVNIEVRKTFDVGIFLNYLKIQHGMYKKTYMYHSKEIFFSSRR